MLPWLFVNALGLVGCLIALFVSLRFPRHRLLVAGLALFVLVTKSVLSNLPVEEAALFPWPWYIYLQEYWVVFGGLIFLGLAIPQLPVRWNQIAVALVALGLLVVGGQWTSWMLGTEPLGAEVAPDSTHHLSQSTGYTCAPCACASAVSHVGVQMTERSMAAACLTRKNRGTTLFNTYRGLAIALGGTAWRPRVRRVTPDDLLVKDQVAVIDFPELRHAITVVGLGDAVTLHDPLLRYPIRMSRADLALRYGGIAVVLELR